VAVTSEQEQTETHEQTSHLQREAQMHIDAPAPGVVDALLLSKQLSYKCITNAAVPAGAFYGQPCWQLTAAPGINV
jgi:hypothetical protein